jgi:hypothetical protein
MYSMVDIDATAYGDLAADTVHQILKQGIALNSTTLSCPAPTTNGFSVNYLIEAIYQDVDTANTVLPYYNASNPASPWSGPNNTGAAQPTVRSGEINLIAKAGIAAPTGTQLNPTPDPGYTGLYIVTVAFGQTTILSGSISVYPGAPFLSGGLLSQAAADLRYLQLAGGTLTGTVIGPNAVFTSLTVNGVSVQNASVFTTGALSPSVVPVGAVTQWQGSLAIAWAQLTGTKNADQLNGLIAGPEGGFTAETLARCDLNGTVWAKYFNHASANSENPTVAQIFVTNGADGYARKASLSWVESQMTLSSIGGSIAAAQVPLAAVSQFQASIKCQNIGGLASTRVTLAADPGTTPTGNPGDVFEYY